LVELTPAPGVSPAMAAAALRRSEPALPMLAAMTIGFGS